jgi:hypothetical protein
MKAAQKYLALLERDCEFLALKLVEARKDIEFYRAKVERLELAIAQAGLTPAQIYPAPANPPMRDKKPVQLGAPHVPFSELKRRWNQLSEAEQEKAMAEGWQVDLEKANKEEEANAGK